MYREDLQRILRCHAYDRVLSAVQRCDPLDFAGHRALTVLAHEIASEIPWIDYLETLTWSSPNDPYYPD